jgi:Skp family chaperone for outer membrane proteins
LRKISFKENMKIRGAIRSFCQIKELHTLMKRFSMFALALVFGAVFAGSALAQAGAQPAATKIGWIDTQAFADEKEGVTKYINALKALNTEMTPRVNELTAIQTKVKTIADDLNKPVPANVPVDQKALIAKQDEGQRLQREFEFKKKEYDAQVEKRSAEVLGPVSADISKAIQDFAKSKGYAVVLDIAALANANAILALDPAANITKEFITFYNARPATAATAATPK